MQKQANLPPAIQVIGGSLRTSTFTPFLFALLITEPNKINKILLSIKKFWCQDKFL